MDERLRTDQRIRSKEDFRQVFRKGRRASGAALSVWALRLSRSGRARLGIVVSRKTHPRAAKRNLWKRRIREAFRRNQREIQSGVSVVIQARHQRAIPTYAEIRSELSALLKETGSLR